MKTILRITAGGIFLFAAAFAAHTQTNHKSSAALKTSTSPASDADVQRGKYLVEEVAKCGECHTPRNDDGELDYSHWLQGAPVWIMPVHPNSHWAERAPALAGFPGYSDQDGFDILEKGVGANGETIRPPMHIYHMKHEDAVAIIAYLRSLSTAAPK
jgi:mono/diheme cytochrome c family protein